MSGWTSLLLTVALPLLLPKLLAWLSGASAARATQSMHTRPPKPHTRYDTLARAVLVALGVAFAVLAVLGRPPNLLGSLGLGADPAPAFETLIEALKASADARVSYLKYGHATFVGCTWCKEPSDYSLVAATAVLMHYAVFLLGMGLGTGVWRKERMRSVATIAACVSAFVDLYALIFTHDLVFDSTPYSGTPSLQSASLWRLYPDSQFNQLHVARCLVFAGVALAAAFIDAPDVWSEREILQDTLHRLQFNYARHDAAMLARESALDDDQLRKKFIDYFLRGDVPGSIPSATSAPKQSKHMRAKILKRFSVARVLNERHAVESFVRLALSENFLSGVELPPVDLAAEAAEVAENVATSQHQQSMQDDVWRQ
ncbi:hypothetical protein BC831DRAFT_450282 [Entophlyctis helioformis]|nr:hypothetical protein BC831DRAFT_450282 [Entophlyctis helioformis]